MTAFQNILNFIQYLSQDGATNMFKAGWPGNKFYIDLNNSSTRGQQSLWSRVQTLLPSGGTVIQIYVELIP